VRCFLCGWLGGFFSFASCNLRLQCAIHGATIDLLFAYRYKKLMTRKAIELYLEALTEEERSAALNQQLLQLRQNSNAKDLKELAHR